MSDHDAILRAVQAFAAAYNSGDLTTVLSYYDDDLVKIRHGARAESKAETEPRDGGEGVAEARREVARGAHDGQCVGGER